MFTPSLHRLANPKPPGHIRKRCRLSSSSKFLNLAVYFGREEGGGAFGLRNIYIGHMVGKPKLQRSLERIVNVIQRIHSGRSDDEDL